MDSPSGVDEALVAPMRTHDEASLVRSAIAAQALPDPSAALLRASFDQAGVGCGVAAGVGEGVGAGDAVGAG